MSWAAIPKAITLGCVGVVPAEAGFRRRGRPRGGRGVAQKANRRACRDRSAGRPAVGPSHPRAAIGAAVVDASIDRDVPIDIAIDVRVAVHVSIDVGITVHVSIDVCAAIDLRATVVAAGLTRAAVVTSGTARAAVMPAAMTHGAAPAATATNV